MTKFFVSAFRILGCLYLILAIGLQGAVSAAVAIAFATLSVSYQLSVRGGRDE